MSIGPLQKGGHSGGTHIIDSMQNRDETRMCIVPNTVRTTCSRVGEMYQTIRSRSRDWRRGKNWGGGGGLLFADDLVLLAESGADLLTSYGIEQYDQLYCMGQKF